MNSKIIIAVVAVLVILGIGGYLVAGNKSSKNASSYSTKMTAEGDTKMATSNESKPMSFKDLITMGISQKCTFTNKMDQMTSEGTVYTSGGKMRGDITSVVNGKTSVTHMIMDSNTSHIWVDGQTQGYTMTLDAKAIADAQKDGQRMNVNVNQKYDYKCSPSVVSDSMFALPTSIKFMDMSSLMPEVSITGTMKTEDMKKVQCAMCNNLTGDPKDQCLKALSCN